jgi:hypothetical protein
MPTIAIDSSACATVREEAPALAVTCSPWIRSSRKPCDVTQPVAQFHGHQRVEPEPFEGLRRVERVVRRASEYASDLDRDRREDDSLAFVSAQPLQARAQRLAAGATRGHWSDAPQQRRQCAGACLRAQCTPVQTRRDHERLLDGAGVVEQAEPFLDGQHHDARARQPGQIAGAQSSGHLACARLLLPLPPRDRHPRETFGAAMGGQSVQ